MTETTTIEGRPKTNRDLGYKLAISQIQTGNPSTKYICRVLQCTSRTYETIKKEVIAQGLAIKKIDLAKLDKESRDFDLECKETMGFSFYDWLKGKTVAYDTIFRFCQKVWKEIWDHPLLYNVTIRTDPLGYQLSQSFLNYYGSDVKRIRQRKFHIRYFFRFMGRTDIMDRDLTVSNARDPRSIRDVPEIILSDFPKKLDSAIFLMKEQLGLEAEVLLKLKLCTQMRTGEKERELWGIRCKETNHSYLIMNSPDEYIFKVSAKMNENWNITWIPKTLREELYQLYLTRSNGEKLFQLNVEDVRKAWKDVCKLMKLPILRLHDLRKVSITWLYVMGIPLEEATRINVGWKDLNTARNHYLQFKDALKKDAKMIYRDNIPAWFKEGLDQYLA